jgi:predicted metal-dependent peptidase
MVKTYFFQGQIDRRLQHYVDEFVKDSNGKVTKDDIKGMKIILHSLEASFENKERMVVGMCNPLTREILIDPSFLRRRSYKAMKALMYHELAHCLLWRFHTSEKMEKDNCEASLMSSYVPSYLCLDKHWDHYVKELFGEK